MFPFDDVIMHEGLKTEVHNGANFVVIGGWPYDNVYDDE